MSVLYMGFPLGDDLEMNEGVAVAVQLKDEARDNRNNGVMENTGFDFKTEFEFWPIQHPTEPSHEDRPVQCPIPHSSHLINDDRFSERKRPEVSTLLHKQNSTQEPPIRAVRKRHHDHTTTITPLLRMPPVYPHLHHNVNPTDFNNLQQLHRFKS